MRELTKLDNMLFWFFDLKLWCKLGHHNWVVSLDDHLKEFETLGLDNRLCNKTVCYNCGKKYEENK